MNKVEKKKKQLLNFQKRKYLAVKKKIALNAETSCLYKSIIGL